MNDVAILDWTPSDELLLKMKRINEMKQTMTYVQIAKDLGLTRRYVISLNMQYKKMKGTL